MKSFENPLRVISASAVLGVGALAAPASAEETAHFAYDDKSHEVTVELPSALPEDVEAYVNKLPASFDGLTEAQIGERVDEATNENDWSGFFAQKVLGKVVINSGVTEATIELEAGECGAMQVDLTTTEVGLKEGDALSTQTAVEHSLKGNVLAGDFMVVPCDTKTGTSVNNPNSGGNKKTVFENLPNTGSALGNIAAYGAAALAAGGAIELTRRRFASAP